MSDLERLLKQARLLPAMTSSQKRSQAIDWAVANLMVDNPEYDEWMLRKAAALSYDQLHAKVRIIR